MFNFRRRINRVTYFAGVGVSFLYLILVIIVFSMFGNESSLDNSTSLAVTAVVLFLASLVPVAIYGICLTKQRSNDISGDNAVLYTFIGIFFLGWIMGVIPGEKAANRYGQIPRKGIKLN